MTAGGRPTRASLEPLLPWVGRNLLLLVAYLLAASALSALFTDFFGEEIAVPRGGLEWGEVGAAFLIYVFYGGSACIPGLAIWMAILARVPAEWSGFERRLAAVVTAPLVGLFWFIFLLASEAEGFAFLFGFMWPLGAGFVVRLRRHAPDALRRSA